MFNGLWNIYFIRFLLRRLYLINYFHKTIKSVITCFSHWIQLIVNEILRGVTFTHFTCLSDSACWSWEARCRRFASPLWTPVVSSTTIWLVRVEGYERRWFSFRRGWAPRWEMLVEQRVSINFANCAFLGIFVSCKEVLSSLRLSMIDWLRHVLIYMILGVEIAVAIIA